MGQVQRPSSVLLIAAASSRYPADLEWCRQRMSEQYGAIALKSPEFEFHETDYYRETMGTGLRKQFLAFETLIEPDRLPAIKLQSNQWEAKFAALKLHPEERPINLDPGYITLAKLVLASTKDHAHRIYLANGIYAETTLTFKSGSWQTYSWTYPDYQRADYQHFFTACRNHFRAIQRAAPS